VYVFGDTCTGKLRALQQVGGKAVRRRPLNLTVPGISSFGQDRAGELYAVVLDGNVYRIVAG